MVFQPVALATPHAVRRTWAAAERLRSPVGKGAPAPVRRTVASSSGDRSVMDRAGPSPPMDQWLGDPPSVSQNGIAWCSERHEGCPAGSAAAPSRKVRDMEAGMHGHGVTEPSPSTRFRLVGRPSAPFSSRTRTPARFPSHCSYCLPIYGHFIGIDERARIATRQLERPSEPD